MREGGREGERERQRERRREGVWEEVTEGEMRWKKGRGEKEGEERSGRKNE